MVVLEFRPTSCCSGGVESGRNSSGGGYAANSRFVFALSWNEVNAL